MKQIVKTGIWGGGSIIILCKIILKNIEPFLK
jgi:hypothetical protein